MSTFKSSLNDGFAMFVFVCMLFFVIFWLPVILLCLQTFMPVNIIAHAIWCGLVVILSFSCGLLVSDDINWKDQVLNVLDQLVDLMQHVKGFSIGMIFPSIPIFGMMLGTWYIYFGIFGYTIVDSMWHMILLPMIHWIAPLYLGKLLRKTSWFSWLSFG